MLTLRKTRQHVVEGHKHVNIPDLCRPDSPLEERGEFTQCTFNVVHVRRALALNMATTPELQGTFGWEGRVEQTD